MIGLALIASPLFLKLPTQFQSFNSTNELESQVMNEKAQVAASEQLERARIDEKKLTADKLQQTGVMPSVNKLKLRRYYDTSKHDPKPDTSGWLASETVLVYDSAGVCVGRIQNRKWQWKHYYKGVCIQSRPTPNSNF